MVLAINSNTGSEYDLKEEYKADSDLAYREMLEIVGQSSFGGNPHSVITAPLKKKKEVAEYLRRATSAKEYQIARLLHLRD